MMIAAAPATKVQVGVPERDNLQYAAFFVARGAGFFAAEGLETELIVANTPAETEQLVRDKKAPLFVLSPPMYLRVISEKAPLVMVANLLENDAIELLLRADVARDKKLSPAAPLTARIQSLKGMKIGVAPGPRARLAAMLAAGGLKMEDVQVVPVAGESQTLLLSEKGVDALFCHTPHLERAIVEQGAIVYVNLSAGEVPELAGRQIHGVFADRTFAKNHRAQVEGVVRAIAKAETLLRTDPNKAIAALMTDLPARDRKKLEALIPIYARAIPATPKVSAPAMKKELDLFPAHHQKPDLTGIDLATFVDDSFASAGAK